MTAWLEHWERIEQHNDLITMKQKDLPQYAQALRIIGLLCACAQSVKMAWHPSMKAVTFENLKYKYGTLKF